MKFISKDGEIVEGDPLNELQVQQREQICAFIHEKVCHGAYHSAWDKKNTFVSCEHVANFFVTKFTMHPIEGTDMAREIELAKEENAPKAIESPASVSLPVADEDRVELMF